MVVLSFAEIKLLTKSQNEPIDIEKDMPLAFYSHLSRWEHRDHFSSCALFLTFLKSHIILFTFFISFIKEHTDVFWVRFGDLLFHMLKM